METLHLALFFGCTESNPLPLLSSLDGWYTFHISAYLKVFALDDQMFAHLVALYVHSKQSNGVEPFGGLLKSTLDDLLRSDCDYLQLS